MYNIMSFDEFKNMNKENDFQMICEVDGKEVFFKSDYVTDIMQDGVRNVICTKQFSRTRVSKYFKGNVGDMFYIETCDIPDNIFTDEKIESKAILLPFDLEESNLPIYVLGKYMEDATELYLEKHPEVKRRQEIKDTFLYMVNELYEKLPQDLLEKPISELTLEDVLSNVIYKFDETGVYSNKDKQEDEYVDLEEIFDEIDPNRFLSDEEYDLYIRYLNVRDRGNYLYSEERNAAKLNEMYKLDYRNVDEIMHKESLKAISKAAKIMRNSERRREKSKVLREAVYDKN